MPHLDLSLFCLKDNLYNKMTMNSDLQGPSKQEYPSPNFAKLAVNFPQAPERKLKRICTNLIFTLTGQILPSAPHWLAALVNSDLNKEFVTQLR